MKKILLLYFLLFTLPGIAQLKFTLIHDFTIQIEDSLFVPEKSWYDSLKSEAANSTLLYQITGVQINGMRATTSIRLPQTLSLPQVFRQIIYYYSIVDSVNREHEHVLIYPFFTKTEQPPFINVVYRNNQFFFKIHLWNRIPVPEEPTPEEKFIYNNLLQDQMTGNLTFGEVTDNQFIQFCRLNNYSLDMVKTIYKKVILWHHKL